MHYLLAGLIGAISGLASGLFGVGGGIVMVPAMLWLLPVRDIKQAIGTSLLVIIPTAVIGTLKHFQQGNVDWRLAAAIAPMALVGGYGGAWLTSVISTAGLKRGFGLVLVAVGFRLLFGR